MNKKLKPQTVLYLVLIVLLGILLMANHFVSKKNERLRAEQKTIVVDVITIEESRLDELAPGDRLIDAVIEAKSDPNKSFKIIRGDDTAEWQEGWDCYCVYNGTTFSSLEDLIKYVALGNREERSILLISILSTTALTNLTGLSSAMNISVSIGSFS